jgi:hypothetical protein
MDVLHMADVVEDTTAIANIMGAYTFLTCYKQHTRQFENWSKNEPTITLNEGKYVGYEAVKGFFVDYNNEQTRWANETMRKLYPEELGGKSDEEIWAVGSNTVLNFTTPLIEVAFDGKTAKGMWYVYGSTTEVYSIGPKAAWNFGRCAVDFIKEDGVWKIWHMTMFTDIQCPVGGNWGSDKMYAHEGAPIPAPTVQEHYYTSYGEDFVSLVAPQLPEPYDTFENTFSY